MSTLQTINRDYLMLLFKLGVRNPFLYDMTAYDWAVYIRNDISSNR